MMGLKTFCTKYCPYRENEDKRNMEPCINCPVETYLDIIEEDNNAYILFKETFSPRD